MNHIVDVSIKALSAHRASFYWPGIELSLNLTSMLVDRNFSDALVKSSVTNSFFMGCEPTVFRSTREKKEKNDGMDMQKRFTSLLEHFLFARNTKYSSSITLNMSSDIGMFFCKA